MVTMASRKFSYAIISLPLKSWGDNKNGERPSFWFPTIIWNINNSINFKFGVCICWESCQNWLALGRGWYNFGPLVAKKRLKMGQYGGFRPLSEKLYRIQFKLVVYPCCVSVQKWFTLGQYWPNFRPLGAKNYFKAGQNGGFRPSSVKVFTQSNFKIETLLGHIGQIVAL